MVMKFRPGEKFTPGEPGWIVIRPSERGWAELPHTGYVGGIVLRIRGDGTRAMPQQLHLSRGQAAELGRMLLDAAGEVTP